MSGLERVPQLVGPLPKSQAHLRLPTFLSGDDYINTIIANTIQGVGTFRLDHLFCSAHDPRLAFVYLSGEGKNQEEHFIM